MKKKLKQATFILLFIKLSAFSQSENELFNFPQYENYWFSIANHSDVVNAPWGISFGNGIVEEEHIHFEDHTNLFTYNFYYARSFDNDNETYGAKLSLTNTIGIGLNLKEKSSLYDPTIEFNLKHYQKVQIENYVLSSSILFLKKISSSIDLKIGYQELNSSKNTGIKLGLSKIKYGNYSAGINIGYWSNYFSYNLNLSKFIHKKKIMAYIKAERIDKNNFLNIGLSYLFKIRRKKNQ